MRRESSPKLLLAYVVVLVCLVALVGLHLGQTRAGQPEQMNNLAENPKTSPGDCILGEAFVQNLPEESIFTDDDEVAVLANGSVINAKYAATIIDGVVVEPGETFSFNQVVGPRTLQTGFVAGLSLSGASLIPDVGGGICRTATALHWAVQEAGMEILEHHNHTQKVPYADEGGDAAVWWDMLDYKFVNDGDDPIRILAQGQGDQVWVAILQEPN